LYTFSSNGALALYSGTGEGVSVGNFNAGTGAYTATSNRHLKTNISLLGSDILDKIALLKPSRYSYIRDPLNQMTIGFMADDVKPLFPELVDAVGENSENMAINYAAFSVVAIKAIQQQQKQMEALQTENEKLKKRLERLENLVASTAQKEND
jgi:cell division protein FtsB